MENTHSGIQTRERKRGKRKLHVKLLLVVFLAFLIWFVFCLPSNLFDNPHSIVIYDREGKLLNARVAADGQWRFPHNNHVPEKFAAAIITFEDKRFRYHPGFDPMALSRAFRDNISSGRIVSGGSTLSMQTIRMSRQKNRGYLQKFLELLLAIRLEFSYSKDEILALYTSNAPFGGNVVGLDAAAWRYYGRPAETLSWAEVATMAVLPNNPALVHPGKNRERLLMRRNGLLAKLSREGFLDKHELELALAESLPLKPHALPMHAPHLLARMGNERSVSKAIAENNYRSSIQLQLQSAVNDIVERHYLQLRQNEIYNIAALVADVETGEVLAYTGNARQSIQGAHNDLVMAHRSSGSILKPLLYASMLSGGYILPESLVPDIPTRIGGYTAQNFNLGYDGAVPAKTALAKSLNIPAIRLLQQYGVEKFHDKLLRLGMNTMPKPPSHYGLSLILGGAESNLWDLCGIYASLARELNFYNNNGAYSKELIHPLRLTAGNTVKARQQEDYYLLDAASIYLMLDAMMEVVRPGEESPWKNFSSTQRVAWKTGTSFGFRDAWAVGVTPRYVVGVWAGNASGEGRPGLTGISAAAPVMFEIFNRLPRASWFEQPLSNMEKINICSSSGFRLGNHCETAEGLFVPAAGLNMPVCNFHQLVFLDQSGNYRVNSNCENMSGLEPKKWFVLPPVQEWYYKNHHPSYKSLPPLREDCRAGTSAASMMELIYPRPGSRIMIPRELDGEMGNAVFEAAHRLPGTRVYWHIDNSFEGITTGFHQLAVQKPKGKYLLTLVDENGERLEMWFEVL